MVALTMLGFVAFDWNDIAPPARFWAVAGDVITAGFAFALYAACRRVRLSPTGVHAAAAVLSFTVLANVLLGAVLHADPLFSSYAAILLIVSVGNMLSPGWAIVVGGVEVACWAVIAPRVLPDAEVESNALLIATSAGVAVVVNVGRHLSRKRIFALRRQDVERQRELELALADADEARRELDRKVEDRTAALRDELAERERLEAQRERLEAQLRHAQKLEAVGRLAGGIAHDFNNLLTVIRMSMRTVCEPETSPDEMRDAIRDVNDATDRAAGLTHDLLAFARKQTLERTTVAVADLLGGVERMVRRVAEATIRLDVRIAPDSGEIVADRHQIEQVLLNLAINACDAMANRGTLTVTADRVELAGGAGGPGLPPGAYVRVAVADTGTGMDEATLRAVFEPFFTTKAVGRGTGLGLAVAHGIVTQHGGRIAVDSVLGRGSTFTVYLPCAQGAPLASAAAAPRPVTVPSREQLLVVEDEAAVRRAVQRNLERLGYRVIAACDGEDALRLIEPLDRVDLVVSDVVMPGIDGPELACRLRAQWPDLPVLFVTGYSADRLARSDAVGPRDRILEKPYQLDELARTIRQMLEPPVAAAS
jgi:signal transduction histidine kinase/ActR/RegA family two-component response regulator